MTTLPLIPTCWREVTPHQVAYIARLRAAGFAPEVAKVYFALRALGVNSVHAVAADVYELSVSGRVITVRPDCLLDAVGALDWMDRAPDYPVRPDRLKGVEALAPDLRDVPFGVYLRITTLARAYVENDHRPDIATRLLCVLYPGFPERAARPWHHLAAYQWVAGLTTWIATKYRDLYPDASTTGEGGSAPSATTAGEQMNSLIRALTGGDILREQAVLDSDTHRALTELNAKAREAAEVRRASSTSH